MARTQRVERLVKEFMQYHREGYSVVEIAEIFQVDFSTAYKHLQEIADANGITRDELLRVPHSEHSSHFPFRKEKIDATAVLNGFNNLEKDIDKVVDEIDTILKNS